MKLYFSTNIYRGYEFDRILPYLEKFPGKLGIEVFPMFHEEAFEPVLKSCLEALNNTFTSFHEPYYFADHTKAAGTPEYERTMDMTRQTLYYMEEIGSKYMVYHHNNCDVDPAEREALLEVSRKNFREIEKLCAEKGILLAVENAGVGPKAIFNEEEFIRECRMLKCPVLIDIGHAFANGWNLERVMEELSVQIISYHLHNNDGVHDSHRRIHDGKLDFDSFLDRCRNITPNADLVLEYSMAVADDVQGIEEDMRFLLEEKRI